MSRHEAAFIDDDIEGAGGREPAFDDDATRSKERAVDSQA